jgi:hypothetical protein
LEVTLTPDDIVVRLPVELEEKEPMERSPTPAVPKFRFSVPEVAVDEPPARLKVTELG